MFLFILSAGFLFVFNDRSLGSVYELRLLELPASMQSKMQVTFSYLDSAGDVSFLSTAEQDHMQDVRNVIFGVKIIFSLSFALLAVIFVSKRELFFSAIKPAVIGVFVFLTIIGVGSLFGFSQVWTWFHHVLFPQGNWMFSVDSTLIQLFPIEFFMAYAREVVVSIGSVALFTLIAKNLFEQSQ